MLPRSRKYVPPTERPPGAPTKKEIDDLTTNHIGGYTKREINRLIEIHKHFVDFHYEPQSSDGGLIPDDGTDPLYYYQSNLPLIQRVMGAKPEKDMDDSDDEHEDVIEQDMEARMQDLRDGVANNAIVSVEKGKLSRVLAIQRFIATNLQETSAIVESLQKNKDAFEVEAEQRVTGQGTLQTQLEMLQALLKFRRDQCNQLKKLTQCLTLKLTDLSAQVDINVSAGKRGAARLRAVVNTVRAVEERTSADQPTGAAASEPDLEFARELLAENQFLRKEQEYLYYRLYGCTSSATSGTGNKETAAASAQAKQPAGLPKSGSALSNASAAALKGTAQANPTRTVDAKQAPHFRGIPQRLTPTEQYHQGPVENHPDFPNTMKHMEKELRKQMEDIYQKMVESEVARQTVNTSRGADVLKKLTGDVEEHKLMIENVHKRALTLFESGTIALKSNRALEEKELQMHDPSKLTKSIEKTVAIRAVKDFKEDATAVGKAIEAFCTRELEPSLCSQTLSSIEFLASELSQLGVPTSEDSLDRMGIGVANCSDAMKFVVLKLVGSLYSVISMFPPSVSTEVSETIAKLLRVLLPQWTEEALLKYAHGVANKTDNYLAATTLDGIKERNLDVRRLFRASRGSSRHKSSRQSARSGDDLYMEGEPLPDNATFESDDSSDGEDDGGIENKKDRQSSGKPTPSRRSLTPLKPVTANEEIQCDLIKLTSSTPPVPELVDDHATPSEHSIRGGSAASFRSASASTRGKPPNNLKGPLSNSATPRSARSNSSAHNPEDVATQTPIVILKSQPVQTDDDSLEGGAQPGSRLGSAKPDSLNSSRTSLSRPVSAMKIFNPLVEGKKGKVPLIPPRGVILIATIGSLNALWRDCPSFMPALEEAYTKLLRDQLNEHHGFEVRLEDSALIAVFGSPMDALEWAYAVQVHAMHLPYPPEMLSLACCNEVPHPEMLEGASGVSQNIELPNAETRRSLDPAILQRWTWRGFRIGISMHFGNIILSSGNNSELTSNNKPPSGIVHNTPTQQTLSASEVEVGGSHFAFTSKLAAVIPAGATVVSGTFIAALEREFSELHGRMMPTKVEFQPWQEVPAPVDTSAGGNTTNNNVALNSVEILNAVQFTSLKLRDPFASLASNSPASCESETEVMGANVVQRWASSFVHQVETLNYGKFSKLAFVIVDIESAEDFPQHNPAALREASSALIEEAATLIRKRGGTSFAKSHRSIIATFDEPLSAVQFGLQFQTQALQSSSYSQEVLMIPVCKERYEENVLTWRGLRPRMTGHFGFAGPVLRHLRTQVLEYFGDTVQHTNELTTMTPLGCFACSRALVNEVEVFIDLLDNPWMLEGKEVVMMLPQALRKREQSIRLSVESKLAPCYHSSVFSLNTFDEKRRSAEYDTGVKSTDEVGAIESRSVYGILSVTQQSILALWADEEKLRQAFQVRLEAALDAEARLGRVTSGKGLPTRRDCREEILRVAMCAIEEVNRIAISKFGGFAGGESSAGFLTNVYVFRNVAMALQCALEIQQRMTTIMESIVPEYLAERLDKVFSAETGQVIMGGILVSTAVHCGPVHVARTPGCRQWAYHGACLEQCATVAFGRCNAGEIIVTDAALRSFKTDCGPSDLGGCDVTDFLQTSVAMQTIEVTGENDDVLILPGELFPKPLHSMTPIEMIDRLSVFKPPHVRAEEISSGSAAKETTASSSSAALSRRALRNLQSKYGFTPFKYLTDTLRSTSHHTRATDVNDDAPSFIHSGTLAHRLFRVVAKVAIKTAKVMGYPVDVDADPSAIDASLREMLQQATRISDSALEDGDGSLARIRNVIDVSVGSILQRSEDVLNGVFLALGARLERVAAMHRSMQSAIIIPPNESNDGALYKNTDVGPGKRVTPSSRPMSREARPGTPSTPSGTGNNSFSTPTSSALVPYGIQTSTQDMISVGTENPRFLSASKRPSSRQRAPTPSKVERGTQQTPADVSLIVTSTLPGAQIPPAWTSSSSLFRPGMGVDIATMRMKEHRIIELERLVEDLSEQLETLRLGQYSAHGDVDHTLALPRSHSAGEQEYSISYLMKQRGRSLTLPPLREFVEKLEGRSSAMSGALTPVVENNDVSTVDKVTHESKNAFVERPATHHEPEERIDFSTQAPLRASSVPTPQLIEGYPSTDDDDNENPEHVAAMAHNMLLMRHMVPSRGNGHWRKSSPLAPLQSSYVTTFQEGLLVSGEASTKDALFSPFTAAASAPKRMARTPIPVAQQRRKPKPHYQGFPTKSVPKPSCVVKAQSDSELAIGDAMPELLQRPPSQEVQQMDPL